MFRQAGWLNDDALRPENIPFLHLQPRLKERFRHEQREDGSLAHLTGDHPSDPSVRSALNAVQGIRRRRAVSDSVLFIVAVSNGA
jgi:hypothetical protein